MQDQDANGGISRGRDFRVSEEMIVAGVADPGPSLDFKTPAGITDTGYSTRSTRRALEKLVQRIDGSEDRPGRNRGDDGKEQRLNGKFPTLFTREITSG